MEKKYVKKFAEIAEKLQTADDKTAYRILERMQFGILEKAMLSLVKKDFSLDKRSAISLLCQTILQDGCKGYDVAMSHGLWCTWFNSKAPDEKIAVGLNCSNLKKVKIFIGHVKKETRWGLLFDENAEFSEPPAKFRTIINSLEGFSVQKPGLWARPLGEAKNLAQATRLIKPIWDSVYNAIKPVGDEW